MFRRLISFAVLWSLLISLPGYAEPRDHRFGIGWSQWGVFDDFDIGTVKLTYEFGKIERAWDIRITTSAFLRVDEDEGYFSVGWLKEWSFGQKWSWGVAGDAGYFYSDSDILGNDLEFYTRGVLNYHHSESGFLRLELGHISNAGFGDRNPGSENLALTYQWAF